MIDWMSFALAMLLAAKAPIMNLHALVMALCLLLYIN